MTKKRSIRKDPNIPEKPTLKAIADRLWGLAVREQWGDLCAVCGNVERDTEAHHLIPRQFEATRYDLRNGIALCARCHKFDPDISPHINAGGWIKWLEENHPLLKLWVLGNPRPRFLGIKNADHYISEIRELRQYVDDSEFERICGVKFTRWLEDDNG